MQPGALLTSREVEIGFRPAARPIIFLTVETGRAEPVLPGEIDRVADAHATLLGAVDKEQAAKRPEGLPAEILFALLIEHDHLEAAPRRLRRRHEAGQAGPDHQKIAIHEKASRAILGKLTHTCA